MQTRRTFLKTTAAALTLLRSNLLSASVVKGQTSQRLSANWEYLNGSLGGPWEVWHSEETAVWSPVTLPHSFNAYDGCDPDTPYYRGNGWYRTHLEINNPYANGRTLLHFEGAGQTTSVYVGDKLAGHHTGGYDEFVIDITDLLPNTQNPTPKTPGTPLSILCDNSRDLDRAPSDLSDFSLYGGLYRHVNLVYVPAVSLEHLYITPTIKAADAPVTITIAGILYAPVPNTAPAEISVQVTDPNGNVVHQSTKNHSISAGPKQLANFNIAKPSLWSPATPNLYTCTLAISSPDGDYTHNETFGIKHTRFEDHGPFILNGERLMLRGTHRHEDHANYANAMPDDLIEQEMKLIKDMGCNFIRLAHYQQSRRVLDLCDKLGILVWEEIPWCRGGIGPDADPHTTTFKNLVRQQLANMINQHYNHPSVLFWGLGNEDDWPTEYPKVDQTAIRAFLTELNDLAHQLDETRYTSIRRCDFAADIVDVYSPSIWAGWYRGVYTEYQATLEAWRPKVKHLIHIEWGADSHAGRHSENPDKVVSSIATGHGTDERGLDYLQTGGEARVSKDGDWSETYACNLFDWHLKVQETLPWFVGSAQWVFKDFTTPVRPENPIPRINQKGVIQRDMTLKESYFVFQSFWSPVLMGHIYGHTWPVRWGAAGEQKMVKVYSNCDTAELFLNGKSLGTKKRNSQDFPCAGLRWTTPFKPGENQLRVIATRAGKTVEDATIFTYQTEKWGPPTELRLKPIERSLSRSKVIDQIEVEATLHDAKGVLCLDAKNTIRFSIAGSGKLIDNLGTPSGSRVVQLQNGRTRITIDQPGKATLAITSEGLPTTFLPIP